VSAPVESWFDELGQRLESVAVDDPEPGTTVCIGLELAGRPGAGWVLSVAGGRARLTHLGSCEAAEDPGAAPPATLVVRDDLAARLVSGEVGVAAALAEGGIRIRGDARHLFAVEPVLAALQRALHEIPPSRSTPPGPSSDAPPEGGQRSRLTGAWHRAPETEPGQAGSTLR